MSKNFRVIKPEIRVLGVDDGTFTPHTKSSVSVVGVVFRGGFWLEGVMHTHVLVDGLDATEKIANMINGSTHRKQLRLIMLNGVTFAGFNVVDMKTLNSMTGLPVVAVTREKPDLPRIKKALQNLPNCEARWQAILNAGELFELSTRVEGEKIFLHVAGISVENAAQIVRLTSSRSNVPEALRVAHLVASGISV